MSLEVIFDSLKWLLSLVKKPACLLVVEDNADDAFILSHYIQNAGFRCEMVTAPELAEGIILNGRHKIIFLDLNFSGMSGIDLMKRIARSRRDVHIVLTPGTMKGLEFATTGYWFSVIGKEITQAEVARALKGLRM